jgi:hypothetical protein
MYRQDREIGNIGDIGAEAFVDYPTQELEAAISLWTGDAGVRGRVVLGWGSGRDREGVLGLV